MNSTGEETVDAQVFAGGDSGTVVVNRDAMKDMPLPFDTLTENVENGTIGGKLDRVVKHIEQRDAHE